jgi:hypothetical protein
VAEIAGVDDLSGVRINRGGVQIKRWVEGSNRPARLVRRQVQLVAQPQIDGELLPLFPVVLNKEAVVSRAQDACVDALSIQRASIKQRVNCVEIPQSFPKRC